MATDRIQHNALTFQKLNHKFLATFGQPLSRFWPNHIVGLDVRRLDSLLVKPRKGETTFEAIRRQWGDAGVELIESLVIGPGDK